MKRIENPQIYAYVNSLVRKGDIMTRFERDKEVLFDLLAEETGVGIGDNKIYFCSELYCDDCLMNSACHKSINEAIRATHKWIAANFEKQHEDIMDYIYETIAVDKWDNYAKCNLLSCRNCLFDKYDSCTELKKKYLNEEV